MSTKTNRKKCLIVVAAFLCSAGSNVKTSFASGTLENVAVTMASLSLAAADTWTEKAPMPTARLGVTSSVVNGKIYAIGGYRAANSPGMKTVEEYDPAADTWTTKADMPTGRRWLSSSEVNGKIYAFGGYTNYGQPGLSTVEEYDPATDTWAQKSDMPTARLGLATGVVNGIVYAIGGASRVGQLLRTVEAYDPLTDTWTRKADMPTPARFFLSTSVVDGKIYAIGGSFGSPSQVVASVEEYDPATNTWTSITIMPEPRFALSTITVNGRIYAFGGRSGNQNFSTVEEYDPAADIWTNKTNMPRPISALSASEVNGKIYAIGGAETATGSHPGLKTVYEYDTGLTVSSPDFNGDGIVDGADISMMVDHWHTDNPLYDIAPLPFGDSFVDVEDLVFFSEHLFEEIDDPALIAHWALDEAEGDIAQDSAGDNFGFVIGGPVWQPGGGQAGGALQFDGTDDVVVAGPTLRPSGAPFSVLAWIKGGAAGQAVISVPGGVNWLGIDPSDGFLMTELTKPGRGAAPLLSETTIIDGQWHRIGFVWDGSNRTLYVDGVAVAQDTQDSMQSPPNGLYIGAGNTMAAGTFFSGMIDDVRIYNRAVHP